MKKMIVGLMMTLLAGAALAATTVLDPGDGRQYLANWCGGQTVKETAESLQDGLAATIVKVTTSCHGSGRGALNQYHMACWRVTFSLDGAIVNQEFINSGSWRQGRPSVQCSVNPDVDAIYVEGNTTLGTALIGSMYRAYVETP